MSTVRKVLLSFQPDLQETVSRNSHVAFAREDITFTGHAAGQPTMPAGED